MGNPSVPMNILQNFLEFWSSFAYYADKADKPEYRKLKKMLLDVSVNYINAQSNIVSSSELSFLQEMFESDNNIHEYMRYLAQLSQPK